MGASEMHFWSKSLFQPTQYFTPDLTGSRDMTSVYNPMTLPPGKAWPENIA
jgi:hypothetical protein